MGWTLAWNLGSPQEIEAAIYQGLLDEFAPGWNVESDVELAAELKADAWAISLIWQVHRRLYNQLDPMKMIEMLPVWEQIFRFLPVPDATLVERRRRVAGRLKASVTNKLARVIDVAQTILEDAYVEVVTPVGVDYWWYMPGVNPGPPGMPFASARAMLAVHMNDTSYPRSELLRRRADLLGELGDMLPAYVIFDVGIGTGHGNSFVTGQGIVGLTLL